MRTLRVLFLSLFAVGSAGCGKKVPADLQAAIDKHHEAALKVASDAVAACPAMKAAAPFQANPMDAPPPPPNPAKGTTLEADLSVMDVLVNCSWPDPRGNGDVMAGTSMPALRKSARVPVLLVTKPEEMPVNTCTKTKVDCEQVVIPSRWRNTEKSADLRITRQGADGARIEVTVVIALD